MITLRRLAALILASAEPVLLVMGSLALLVIILVAVISWIAIFARDEKRRDNAQTVLRTLFNRGRQ